MFLCSCTGTSFLAGSADPGDGGIYVLQKKDCSEKKIAAPTLNYLIRDRKEPSRLYATLGRHLSEKSRSGAVGIFREQPGGGISLVQCVSAEGRTPCHLTLSPDRAFLYTANYSSGDISELPLDHEGRVCGKVRIIPHSGRSVTPRQKGPHPHFVSFDPAGKQLYVCDLGSDEIRIYDYRPGRGIILPCAEILHLPPGSGVRHLAFAPDGKTLYTANELNSTATSFIRRNSGERWKQLETHSTLKNPSAFSGKNYPGAIRITKDGRYFFITNRGENTLAFFETLPSGAFVLLDTVDSGGDFPSDILIFPDGKHLAVIHLKSHNVTLFELDGQKKRLLRKEESYKVKRGMTLTF